MGGMLRVRYFTVGKRAEQLLSQWVTSIMVVVNICLGIAVTFTSIDRFRGPSYQPLIEFVGGRLWVWGLVFIGSGLLMMTPFRWPNIVGLWLSMYAHIVWSVFFVVALLTSPFSGPTAPIAYTGFATISAALLTVRIIEKSKPPEG